MFSKETLGYQVWETWVASKDASEVGLAESRYTGVDSQQHRALDFLLKPYEGGMWFVSGDPAGPSGCAERRKFPMIRRELVYVERAGSVVESDHPHFGRRIKVKTYSPDTGQRKEFSPFVITFNLEPVYLI